MKRLNSFITKKLIEIGISIGVYKKHMLPYCIKNKMIREAMILVDKCVGVNVINKDGDTLLHIAIREDMDVLAKKMIVGGFNLNIANKDGKTPLHIAVNKGNINVVKMLIKSNANVNAKDKFFRTPLHYAVTKNDRDISKLLIDSKACLDIKDLNGETALYRAVKYRRDKVEDLLLDNSKDINVVNKYECNLLHVAINMNNDRIIPKLLAMGISINKKNIVGETPLVFAVTKGNLGIAKLLIENGADMEAMENLEKVELIDISVQRGCRDMIMMLLRNGANITTYFTRWANRIGDKDILREIEKRVAVHNNDVDKIRYIIQDEISKGYEYDNKKLLEIAIANGREDISCILMHNLTNDTVNTLRKLLWDKDINYALDKSASKVIRRNKNCYIRKLILDCIYKAGARNINTM